MNFPRTEITPLFEGIVRDNPTYKFPVNLIENELMSMFLSQDEFEYFMMEAYKKLKKDASYVIANIFLTALETILDTAKTDVHNLSKEEYQSKLDRFISIVEDMHITIIDKNTPDGEVISALE